MVEEAPAKANEAVTTSPVQVQTGDIEVAKLQLAARWVEMNVDGKNLEQWLKEFGRAYRGIDEAMRP